MCSCGASSPPSSGSFAICVGIARSCFIRYREPVRLMRHSATKAVAGGVLSRRSSALGSGVGWPDFRFGSRADGGPPRPMPQPPSRSFEAIPEPNQVL